MYFICLPGLNRCGKSCRLRWLNYLRPDIKRGNISLAEDDLILRLHRLLGNRWSLIARRLPGRTDNEIKNYWNAHLRKKAKLMDQLPAVSTIASVENYDDNQDEDEDEDEDEDDEEEEEDEDGNGENMSSLMEMEGEAVKEGTTSSLGIEGDDQLFDFSRRGTCGLDWVKTFLELEEEDEKEKEKEDS